MKESSECLHLFTQRVYFARSEVTPFTGNLHLSTKVLALLPKCTRFFSFTCANFTWMKKLLIAGLPDLMKLLVSILRYSSDPGREKLCRTELSGGKRSLKKENYVELVKKHDNGWTAAKIKKNSSKNKQPSVK